MLASGDTLGPFVLLAAICGFPLAAWTVGRLLSHRERMEMIRRGLVPPVEPPLWSRGLQPGTHWHWHAAPRGRRDAPRPEALLRRGITTAMVGVALLIGLGFLGYQAPAGPLWIPTIRPGPWLLVGLVPMFVGAAQVVGAVLAGAGAGARVPGDNSSAGDDGFSRATLPRER